MLVYQRVHCLQNQIFVGSFPWIIVFWASIFLHPACRNKSTLGSQHLKKKLQESLLRCPKLRFQKKNFPQKRPGFTIRNWKKLFNFSLFQWDFSWFDRILPTCTFWIGNVNPKVINPKRLFNWGGTIEKYWINYDYWRSTPPNFHKPSFSLIRGWH